MYGLRACCGIPCRAWWPCWICYAVLVSGYTVIYILEIDKRCAAVCLYICVGLSCLVLLFEYINGIKTAACYISGLGVSVTLAAVIRLTASAALRERVGRVDFRGAGRETCPPWLLAWAWVCRLVWPRLLAWLVCCCLVYRLELSADIGSGLG